MKTVMSSGFEMGSRGGGGLLAPERPRPTQRGTGGDFPPIDWGDWDGFGGGGGDGDDGEGHSGDEFRGKPPRSFEEAAELGLGLGLLAIGMLFVVFLATYVFMARSASEWPPADSPRTPLGLWLSTLILVASSICMSRAVREGREERKERSFRLLVLALLGGIAFLAIQIHVWRELHMAGLLPSSNGYGAIFYALTGLHGAHVLGGVAYLSMLLVRLRKGSEPQLGRSTVPLCGIYWHFIGVIWVVLFCVLYFPA